MPCVDKNFNMRHEVTALRKMRVALRTSFLFLNETTLWTNSATIDSSAAVWADCLSQKRDVIGLQGTQRYNIDEGIIKHKGKMMSMD